MIFKVPPQFGQFSTSMSKTLEQPTQLMRAGTPLQSAGKRHASDDEEEPKHPHAPRA
jgi:hypothetical protein